MLVNAVFDDKTISFQAEPENYTWIFDPQLGLLMLFPQLNDFPKAQRLIWHKIVNFCQQEQWSNWFSHQSPSPFKSGHFIFNTDSVELLYQRYQPRYLWFIGDSHPVFSFKKVKLFNTKHFQHWLKQPLIKKQIWHIWTDIQQDLV